MYTTTNGHAIIAIGFSLCGCFSSVIFSLRFFIVGFFHLLFPVCILYNIRFVHDTIGNFPIASFKKHIQHQQIYKTSSNRNLINLYIGFVQSFDFAHLFLLKFFNYHPSFRYTIISHSNVRYDLCSVQRVERLYASIK